MFNVRVFFNKVAVDRCVYKNLFKLIHSRNLCSLRSSKNVCCAKSHCARTVFQSGICKPMYYFNSFYSNGPNTDINKLEEPVAQSSNELYSSVEYNAITDGDENMLKKLKILMLEVDVMKQEGLKVPSKLSTEQWKELLTLETRSKRRRFLGFIWLNEKKRLSDERKKAKRKQEILERKEVVQKEQEENDHIIYGFRGVTIFLRIYETSMNMHYNNRLIQAMKFGQKCVIDCGYEEHMTNMEAKNCAKQLMLMFAANRVHNDPYDLHFCNANPEYRTIKQLNKHIPTLYEPDFPINITEKNYLDLFPKEKLVYLTPHCRDELKEYDHDAIYIIGAMVDKANSEPLSLAKAKSEGIKMACFPLDRYLDWHIGSKSLTLNQSLSIILDMKYTGKWMEALKHVPKRKTDRKDAQRCLKKFRVRPGELKFPSLLDRI